MDWLAKALGWTVMIGFGLIGIYLGLVVLRVALGVTGFLLGSSFGTVILILIAWHIWKKYKDEIL